VRFEGGRQQEVAQRVSRAVGMCLCQAGSGGRYCYRTSPLQFSPGGVPRYSWCVKPIQLYRSALQTLQEPVC
jgi:hypothetical protein